MSLLIDTAEVQRVTGGWDYSGLAPNIRVGRDCYPRTAGQLQTFPQHPRSWIETG
jgi:hypothetical protein